MLTPFELELAGVTVGCRQCDADKGAYLVSKSYPAAGFFSTECYDTVGKNVTENAICENGSIMQLVGLIKSERKLECKSC